MKKEKYELKEKRKWMG